MFWIIYYKVHQQNSFWTTKLALWLYVQCLFKQTPLDKLFIFVQKHFIWTLYVGSIVMSVMSLSELFNLWRLLLITISYVVLFLFLGGLRLQRKILSISMWSARLLHRRVHAIMSVHIIITFKWQTKTFTTCDISNYLWNVVLFYTKLR